MSLIPAFEIGVWNAWIFTAALFVFFFLPFLLQSIVNKAAAERSPSTTVPLNKPEKKVNICASVIMALLVIYSIFLPLQLGTAWFYTGLIIYLLVFIIGVIIAVNWFTTPPGEPITKGLYRYSRHPMYIMQALMFIGMGIASASWVFILLSVARTISTLIIAIPEERSCLEKYGDAYREYMNRTPRWLGMPKS